MTRLEALRAEHGQARQLASGLVGWAAELVRDGAPSARVDSMLAGAADWRRRARNLRRRIRRLEAAHA